LHKVQQHCRDVFFEDNVLTFILHLSTFWN